MSEDPKKAASALDLWDMWRALPPAQKAIAFAFVLELAREQAGRA
jgi:hypothetical protein